MTERVWVDGKSLWDGEVTWGGLTRTHRADGGSDTASVRVEGVDPNVIPASFRRGKKFQVTFGTLPVWTGLVSEYDREGGVLHAAGLWREAGAQGSGYLALNAAGNVTSNPHVAVTEAIARGLSWTYKGDLPNADHSSSSSPSGLNYLTQLLDAVATERGKRWLVDADGIVSLRADDTAPTWALTPGLGLMGTADDDYVSHVYGRRVSAVSGTPPVPSSWANHLAGSAKAATDHGRREVKVDLTKLGLIDAPKAQAILDGMLAKAGARMGFSNAVNVASFELTNLGGTPAPLELVQPGQMVRAFGVIDEGGGTAYGSTLDFVIEETRHGDADSLYIAPVGLAPRSLSDVLADPPAPDEEYVG